MKKMMMSAALGALVISTSFATPARATDPVAVGAAVKLVLGAGLLLRGAGARGSGTSVNTQYALTGQGRPVMNNGQQAGAPTMAPMMMTCNAHGTHCTMMPMGAGD